MEKLASKEIFIQYHKVGEVYLRYKFLLTLRWSCGFGQESRLYMAIGD